MGYRRETKRFHVETGPKPLFDRVLFKMNGVRELGLQGDHVQKRAIERNAPLHLIKHFNSDNWVLRTVDVDVKKAKFVKSAWHNQLEGKDWWIVIGLGDVLMTIIDTDKFGLGREIAQLGSFYDHVADVNKKLMDAEAA